MSLWQTADIFQKLHSLEADCELAMGGNLGQAPLAIARDARVVDPKELPEKPGLSFQEGQARMLHDLASIELQAMELGLRTLNDFKETPDEFKQQLREIVFDEAKHLKLCLQGIEQLGYSWGDWPVHTALWDCVSSEDSLLDRILIVHRYLEGSGIDAGDTLMRRLSGVHCPPAEKAVRVIAEEEVGHVAFGSRWYQTFCKTLVLDPDEDFKQRFDSLCSRLPKRLEKLSVDLRRKAGFTDIEIHHLNQYRDHLINSWKN